MRKQILSLFVALCLLMSCAAVGAEDVYTLIDNALYRIVQRTESGDTFLGSGVLFLDARILLTAEGCCRDGQLFAIGKDGEHAIQAVEKAGNSGVVLMEMAEPSSAVPLTLSDFSAGTQPWVFGINRQGEVGSLPLYQARWGVFRDRDSLVLISEDGMLPGAVAVDEQGAVVAVAVGQQGEGFGMYTALDADGVYDAMFPAQNSPFLPVELTWQGGFLTASWEDTQRTSGLYIITISGDYNSYYTTYETSAEERSVEFAVPPGHTYYVQVQWAKYANAAQDPEWRTMETLIVPEFPLRQMSYTQECYYTSAPAGSEVSGILPDMGPLTMAALSSGQDNYLQVISRYNVAEDFDLPMAVELIAPDGQFYFEEHLFMFSPEWEEEDCSLLPLDEMLSTCQEFSGGVLPKGEYRVRYAIGGYVAGEYGFTLE